MSGVGRCGRIAAGERGHHGCVANRPAEGAIADRLELRVPARRRHPDLDLDLRVAGGSQRRRHPAGGAGNRERAGGSARSRCALRRRSRQKWARLYSARRRNRAARHHERSKRLTRRRRIERLCRHRHRAARGRRAAEQESHGSPWERATNGVRYHSDHASSTGSRAPATPRCRSDAAHAPLPDCPGAWRRDGPERVGARRSVRRAVQAGAGAERRDEDADGVVRRDDHVHAADQAAGRERHAGRRAARRASRCATPSPTSASC